jgi:hypothetical protein
MLAKIENGVVTKWPLAEQYVQHENPNTSFAFPLNDGTLAQFGFARFEYTDPPAYDIEFQEAKEITPKLNGLVAVQSWEIKEKYTAEEKAAYIIKRDQEQLVFRQKTARQQRDTLLTATDWTQVADVPQVTKDKWAPYRQALRDVPQQSGFPWTVNWPDQPA